AMTTTDAVAAQKRDTRKRDRLPRGIFRHPASTNKAMVYAIRYTCGAGHIHQEKAGPIKSDALRVYHERRAPADDEAGWCPKVERQQARAHAKADQARERARVTFRDHAADFLAWSQQHKRAWKTDRGIVGRAVRVLGDRKLDEITTAEVEQFRDSLLE